MRADDDLVSPSRPDGLVERLPATRPWRRPASYAPLVPRLARGEPAARPDRRSRPRLGNEVRGRLIDLLG
jgi:hypothetical protein